MLLPPQFYSGSSPEEIQVILHEVTTAMPLVRSESQGGGDVSKHYCDSDDRRDEHRESLAAMRDLIPRLDAGLPHTQVWGLTSHYRLLLMSTPNYDGETHLQIQHWNGQFHLEYYPPPGELPIADSYVGFRVTEVKDAVIQIKIAMAASKGWPNSPDLSNS